MIWTELAEMSDGPPATPPGGQEKRKQKGKSGSVKKKLRLARATKHAKQVADKKAATSAEKEEAPPRGGSAASNGAAPNAVLPSPAQQRPVQQPPEAADEARARATFNRGADRNEPWTHHFDIRLHPPRIKQGRQGVRNRVLCSAFSKAPWPPPFERPLHHPSKLQRDVYDVTYPSEEAAQRGMFTDLMA